MPIYKVEQYLHECIDSIISQTYSNLEIILVDDGSPDNCGKICDEYAEKDSKIKVIHKPNGGLSDARNVGLEIATGEYLAFIDSDDWISKDMFEVLYDNILKYSADISCCAYYHAYANKNIPYHIRVAIDILNSEQAMKFAINHERVFCMAWGKLYKKYIFDSIRYPLGKCNEDEFVILDILHKANVIVYNTKSMYYYRQRKASIMGEVSTMYQPRRLDAIEAFEMRIEFVKARYPALVDISKDKLFRTSLRVLLLMLESKKYRKIPERKKLLRILRENHEAVMKSPLISKEEKLKFSILRRSVTLYRVLKFLNGFRKKMHTYVTPANDKILFE